MDFLRSFQSHFERDTLEYAMIQSLIFRRELVELDHGPQEEEEEAQ